MLFKLFLRVLVLCTWVQCLHNLLLSEYKKSEMFRNIVNIWPRWNYFVWRRRSFESVSWFQKNSIVKIAVFRVSVGFFFSFSLLSFFERTVKFALAKLILLWFLESLSFCMSEKCRLIHFFSRRKILELTKFFSKL